MDKVFVDTQLEKYRFNPNLEDTFNVADLLDETYLKDFLKNLSDVIGAPSEKIAASILIKRYAFLAVMSLYAMTALNKKLNVSLDNIKMETAIQGKDWLPGISLKDADLQGWDGNDRAEWRSRVLKDLFANNIYPLISHLEKTVGISKLILWENIAVYLFWLYETELIDNDQAAGDFRYLISEAEGMLFGRYNLNPLPKYFAEKTYLQEWDAEVRVRKTCCFTYQLPAGKRCKTCPCTHIAKDRRCHDGENICEAVRSFA
ncbi:IucA/IucC family C-terminal-domain containing protein [Bacillus sp. X1(2014)]|uniref:IucA/IucC family C-terminal-domain containing protein n=1 Tax=Bacillus sp. X1(2014) TaxID=1565991 RepID=UPI00119E9F4F|nr:IucA/IucC family C-terminal-domain containing protein [Bacillus sp. X1(2014)]